MATAAVKASSFLTSSIGQKLVMSLTGIFLVTFLIAHLAGNLLLFQGKEAFDAYARFMATSPLIRLPEILMFLGFMLHIYQGIKLNSQNTAARPVGYKVNAGAKNSSFFSRYMVHSGIIVLIFLLIHLYSFFVRHRILHNAGDSMYDTVVEAFANPFYSMFYIVALVLLAFHLNHGIQSAFQSLGLQVNKRLGAKFQSAGTFLAVAICAGFASIPLYFMLVAQGIL
jgi:succinate dehydrogenase / fumarate reductase cytochrome b subunit